MWVTSGLLCGSVGKWVSECDPLSTLVDKIIIIVYKLNITTMAIYRVAEATFDRSGHISAVSKVDLNFKDQYLKQEIYA